LPPSKVNPNTLVKDYTNLLSSTYFGDIPISSSGVNKTTIFGLFVY